MQLNSFMKEAVIIQKPVHSKSVDWFLYETASVMKELKLMQQIYAI